MGWTKVICLQSLSRNNSSWKILIYNQLFRYLIFRAMANIIWVFDTFTSISKKPFNAPNFLLSINKSLLSQKLSIWSMLWKYHLLSSEIIVNDPQFLYFLNVDKISCLTTSAFCTKEFKHYLNYQVIYIPLIIISRERTFISPRRHLFLCCQIEISFCGWPVLFLYFSLEFEYIYI